MLKKHYFRTVVIAFAAIGFLSAPLLGATFTVTKTADSNDGMCDSDCSLREALSAANAASSDDVIAFDPTVFSSSQTITLSGVALDVSNNGTLAVNGPGASLLAISGDDQSRVFTLAASSNVTFNGLTITHGSSGINDGGAIYLNSQSISSLVINDCVITANAAGSDILGGSGGGIYVSSFGTVSINNSIISNNSSGGVAGGLYSGAATLSISNTNINGNSTRFSGGGVYISLGNSTIAGSSVTNNTATSQDGGGIYCSCTLTLTNSTVSGNTASGTGAGILISNLGNVSTLHATISGNRAGSNGGGGDGGGVRNSGQFSARNTLIGDNTMGTINLNFPSDFRGNFNSLGHNLVEATTNLVLTNPNNDILGRDPQLGALRDNGSDRLTVAPQSTSPAIDAGDPVNIPASDQRGIQRSLDGDLDGVSAPDIGAYERSPTIFLVTKLADTNDGNCDSDCCLREAVSAASASTSLDKTITFDPMIFTANETVQLTLGELVTTGDLGLFGLPSLHLSISGSNMSRIATISSGSFLGIRRLEITAGNGVGALASGRGGAILVGSGATLGAIDSQLTNSTSSVAAFGGGAVSVSSGRLLAARTSFSGNSVDLTDDFGFGGGGRFRF